MALTESYSGAKTIYQNAKDLVNAQVEQYIVIPKDENLGIAGLIFDVVLKEEIGFKSTPTENYVEDGSVITDHIIKEAVKITINGEVSEMYWRPSQSSPNAIVKRLADIQSNFGEYAPPFLNSQISKIQSFALGAQGLVDKIDRALDKVDTLFGLSNKDESASRQQQAYDFLSACWKTKQVFQVQTKNEIFSNMTIIALTQTNENNSFTSFSVVMQELRFAQTKTVDAIKKYAKKPSSGSAKTQTEKTSDKGKVDGVKTSVLSRLTK